MPVLLSQVHLSPAGNNAINVMWATGTYKVSAQAALLMYTA